MSSPSASCSAAETRSPSNALAFGEGWESLQQWATTSELDGAEPLRITFVITELDDGGAERALVQIASRLASKGHSVTVISLAARGPLATPLEDGGVAVVSLGWRGIASVLRLRALRAEIAKSQPHVVVSFLFHANFATRLTGGFGRAPHVSTHRVAERGRRWHHLLDRWTGRRSRWHVAVSRGVRDCLLEERITPKDRCLVIPNGVDAERFATAEPEPDAWRAGPGPRLLAVGRLHRQKGFDALVPAVAALRERGDAVRVLIVGEGEQRPALERLVAELSCGDCVQFAGRRDPAPLYRAADLFVLSSRWEGMPNVLLEAIAAGCPVVATDVEGVRELLPDAPLPTPKTTSLASAIAEALADPDRNTVAKQRAERIRRSMTWGHVADTWESVLRAVVAEAAATSATTTD